MMQIYVTMKLLFRNWPVLVDILKKLSNMNKPMQDRQINISTENDKVNSFMKNIEFWKGVIEYNISNMFSIFGKCPISEKEINRKLFVNH
jgi:hypothetical protein